MARRGFPSLEGVIQNGEVGSIAIGVQVVCFRVFTGAIASWIHVRRAAGQDKAINFKQLRLKLCRWLV